MYNYANGLDKYVETRRTKVADENAEIAKRIRAFLKNTAQCPIVIVLTENILKSLERCSKEIYDKSNSTMSFISNLRFLFETCITVRLLNKEPNFKYKLRYSIYRHQLNKSSSLKKYAYVDKQRLKKFCSDEEAIKVNSGGDIQQLITKQNLVDSLYDDLDKEISLFLDMVEYNGADFHQIYIDKFLEGHNQRESKIAEEWETIKKDLIKDETANSLFDFRGQISKIEKELGDNRNWKEKAKIVGLGNIHDFIYDYTSSILHCTSYSLFIPNQLENPEITMITSLATRLASDTSRQLCFFAKIPNPSAN